MHQNFALATTEEHTLRLAVQTMVKANDQMWAQRHGDFLWIVTNDWVGARCPAMVGEAFVRRAGGLGMVDKGAACLDSGSRSIQAEL